jgi:predicted nucleic-acid-binding Zn-ribbon protein
MTVIATDQHCMKCGDVMFEKVRLDAEGHMAVSTATQAEMDQDEDDLYFRCQKCGAKNLVEMDLSPSGLPQLRFTRLKP